MVSEAEYVTENFRKNFSCYREENIAIYGLGLNTKVLLEAFPEYHIVGLMDGARTGEKVWGHPVIDCKEAYDKDVRMILILARA